MKSITINQLKFAVSLLLLTILFRFALSASLNDMQFTWVWVIAGLYALSVFITAWIIGKMDYETLPLYDIGFKFHLITYLTCNLIAELWFLFGFQSRFENIKTVHYTALFWGIGLILHFIIFLYTRKDSIKGIEKSEIFE